MLDFLHGQATPYSLRMNESPSPIYAGLSNVTYEGEPFDFGQGVVLKSTFAHLLTVNLMAFARAPEGQPHPPPWRAANGGFGYDIEVELAVPGVGELRGGLSPEDTAWLIAALLRLVHYPFLAMPVLSDVSFDTARRIEEPLLRPVEIAPRLLSATDAEVAKLQAEDLEWVREVWPRTAELLSKSPPLNLALRALDACTVSGRKASALLTAWGALEELFAPSRAELRFRVSAHIAAYLERAGPERLKLFKQVAKLYDTRSKAAHSAQDVEVGALVNSYVILRNALVRMIDEGAVPTQDDFERLLFCGEAHDN